MCTNNALRPESRWRIVASWIPSTSGCRKTVVVTSVIFTNVPCTFTPPQRASTTTRRPRTTCTTWPLSVSAHTPSTLGARGGTLPRMAAESTSAGRLHELNPDIPVREGEYGDRVMAVEPGGIEYIALDERHGKPRQLFWTWN